MTAPDPHRPPSGPPAGFGSGEPPAAGGAVPAAGRLRPVRDRILPWVDSVRHRLVSGSPARRRFGAAVARYGPLGLVLLVVLLLKVPVLLGSPYPPGGDTAEETLWVHAWAGTAFPGAPSPWTIPPLYLFLVLGPALAALPIFSAGIAADFVVSALLVPPAYLLCRRISLRPRFALLGSFLLGSAAAYSSMLTWNGGYNLFGIAMLTFFLAFLLESLETGSRRAVILAGLSIGLVAASNFLSLFVAALVLGILALLLVPMAARASLLRRWAAVVGAGLVAAAPSAYIYFELTHGLSNTVGSAWELTPSLTALYTLTTPWGGLTNGVAQLIAGIDTAVSALGLVALFRKRPTRRAAALLTSVLAASFLVAVADPGNFTRGYYYLPLVFLPAGTFLFQAIYDGTVRRLRAGETPRAGAAPFRPGEPRPGPAAEVYGDPRRRRRRRALRTVLGALAAGLIAFSLANTALSAETFRASAAYYDPMTPETVDALQWLGAHTPDGASVYTSSAYDAKWIWAYDNRQALYPANLNLLVTQSSYAQTEDGNLLALGDLDIGNSQINVAANFEAAAGSPTIDLATPGFWNELFGSNGSATHLTVLRSGALQTVALAAATARPAPILETGPGGTATLALTYDWPTASGGPLALTETIVVNGSATTVAWTSAAPGVTVQSLAQQLTLPPSTTATTGFEHAAVPAGCVASALVQPLQYLTDSFSATVGAAGARFCLQAMAGGWTSVNYTGPADWSLSVDGYPSYFPTSPYARDALAFLPEYQVRYLLLDGSDGYPDFGASLLARFSPPGPATGLDAVPCWTAGSLHVIGLGGC